MAYGAPDESLQPPPGGWGEDPSARGRGLLRPWLLIGAFGLAACGSSGDLAPPSVVDVHALASPAAAGSGEPHLGVDSAGVLLSWLEASGDDTHTLYLDRRTEEGWRGRRPVASGRDFFVNWADFPSVTPTGGGVLTAHWLVRGEAGGYDYGIRVAFSRDDGRSWSEPWIPHEDGTPTEHGFVSVFPLDDGRVGLAWLDGRDFAAAPPGAGSHPGSDGEGSDENGPEMSVRFRSASWDGAPGPEVLLDERTCDCCQTDAAVTARGPVLVYRDRSPQEVRDIRLTRLEAGKWTEPVLVHDDGWVFPACPVNGPAVAARGSRLAVAWFTGAEDTPRVRTAFSSNAGDTFTPPVRVDDGDPAGRVDVELLEDGSALVSWLERGDGSARIRVRRIWPDGTRGEGTTVGSSSGGRSSGFPRMALDGSGGVLFAWTDDTGSEPRVRLARGRLRVASTSPGGP